MGTRAYTHIVPELPVIPIVHTLSAFASVGGNLIAPEASSLQSGLANRLHVMNSPLVRQFWRVPVEGCVGLQGQLVVGDVAGLERYGNLSSASILLLLFGGAILALVSNGIHLEIPGLGTFAVSGGQVEIPYSGTYTIAYQPVWTALRMNMFEMGNWNLLWYLLFVTIVLVA